MLATFLGAAVESGHTRVVQKMVAKKLLFDRHGRVNGVLCVDATSHREIAIQASRVVCAAGALGTPPLLHRSGVKANKNVGQHLRLHPVLFLNAVMPPNVEVGPGPLLSAIITEHDHFEGSEYGPKLEGSCIFTGFEIDC
jgi:long-chain-alcohol oxidase